MFLSRSLSLQTRQVKAYHCTDEPPVLVSARSSTEFRGITAFPVLETSRLLQRTRSISEGRTDGSAARHVEKLSGKPSVRDTIVLGCREISSDHHLKPRTSGDK